jgi:putative permease
MVFFFLKDKELILGWLGDFLPDERRLVRKVWNDMDLKIASYVRGKFIEVIVIWVSTYIAFALMGLNYAMLLGLLVGLSVIVPYVGATVVTIPVALVAFSQWGISSEFGYLMGIYAFIQFLDGNLLVPLLFSEVVNLHPIAIIVAVVFFGSLWGVWGVFFAIPLATLIQAIIKAWPEQETIIEKTS